MFLHSLKFDNSASEARIALNSPDEDVCVYAHESDHGTLVHANMSPSGKHLLVTAHSIGSTHCVGYTTHPEFDPPTTWTPILYVTVRGGKIVRHAERAKANLPHPFGWKRELAKAVIAADRVGRVPSRLQAAWMASFGAPVADWDPSYVVAAREWLSE